MCKKSIVRNMLPVLGLSLSILAATANAQDAQIFLSVSEAAARVQSSAGVQEAPAYGFLGFASLSSAPPPGSQVQMPEMVFDIPTDFPPGPMHVEIIQTALLTVNADGSATGPVLVSVSLPLFDVELTVQANGLLSPGNEHFNLAFILGQEPNRPEFSVEVRALLGQDAVSREEIARLIAELDSDNVEVRSEAQARLLRIGQAALKQLEAALQKPLSNEQKLRLINIITQIKGVTTTSVTWIGDGVGVFNFTFKVHVSNHQPFSNTVFDLHFPVAAPGKDPANNANSTVTIENFPEGWSGSYDKEKGQYIITSSNNNPIPLKPCDGNYEITIRTGTIANPNPGGNPVDKLGVMGWFYTDMNGKVIHAGQTAKGPILP